MNNNEIIYYKSLVKLYRNDTLKFEDLYKYWKNYKGNNPQNCADCPFCMKSSFSSKTNANFYCALLDKYLGKISFEDEMNKECPFITFMQQKVLDTFSKAIKPKKVIDIDKDCSDCVKYKFILNNFDVRCTKCNPIIITKLTKEDLEWEEMNFNGLRNDLDKLKGD